MGGPNVITGVLIKKQEGQREDDVTMGAEVGVTSFEDGGRGHKPKNTGCLQKLEKIRFYSKPSRKDLPCQHHDKPSITFPGSLAFRTIKEYVCIVLSHQGCGYSNNRKLIQKI